MKGSRRRRGSAPVHKGHRAASRPRGGRRLRSAAFVATVIAIMGLGGFLVWRGIARRPAPPAATSPQAYLDLARAAEARGEFEEAFALYAEAVHRYPGQGLLLLSYGAAISNRSFMVRPNRGRLVPLAPTSHARTRAAREALALFDAAERAHPDDGAPALQRGLTCASWGLPEDALMELYRAHLLKGPADEIERVANTITLLQLGGTPGPGRGTP